MEQRCGPFIFFSNFDSGNLARVDKVETVAPPPTVAADSDAEKEDSANTQEIKPDHAFNVWVSPDCAGSPYQNGNRSWFHFGVRGYLSSHTIRITVMNMNRQSKLYSQGYNVIAKFFPGRPTWERLRIKPTYKITDTSFMLTFTCTFPHFCDSAYFAFCYPWSYEESQIYLAQLDSQFSYCLYPRSDSATGDSIYYYRETLCYSLQGRKVDLITVSDYSNMLPDPEPRFDSRLFPQSKERCRAFRNKRVFVLTSRVHPGETPGSFVFNGFLNFILRPNDFRAKRLRQLYIFKLIPMLNPDGVYCGHYRTDTRGVNLNRVYLDPSWDLFPTIYAAKALIVFHHVNNRVRSGSLEIANNNTGGSNNEAAENVHAEANDKSTSPLVDYANEDDTSTPLQPAAVTEALAASRLFNDEFLKQHRDMRKSASAPMLRHPSYAVFLEQQLRRGKPAGSSSVTEGKSVQQSSMINLSKLSDFEEEKVHFTVGNEGSDEDDIDFTPPVCAAEVVKYAPHLCDKSLLDIPSSMSGVAFYVDLHGHASKRGCFIYGNHLDDETAQVDNVTFAKLISLNSQHFDFDGCNFSEKNMYTRDRHDNSSKEGSGRVAIHKAIGIIHSYTLECNYNMGRMTNVLAACSGIGSGRTTPPPPPSYMPSRFTPAHFEEVGRGVAIAALDMFGENPCSRVPNTEFSCLSRLKEWVRYRVLAGRAEARLYRTGVSGPVIGSSAAKGMNAQSLKQRSLSMPTAAAITRTNGINKTPPKPAQQQANRAPANPRQGSTQTKQPTSPTKRTLSFTTKCSPNLNKQLAGANILIGSVEEVPINGDQPPAAKINATSMDSSSKWPSMCAPPTYSLSVALAEGNSPEMRANRKNELSPPANNKSSLRSTSPMRQPQQLLALTKVEPAFTMPAQTVPQWPATICAPTPQSKSPFLQSAFRLSPEKTPLVQIIPPAESASNSGNTVNSSSTNTTSGNGNGTSENVTARKTSRTPADIHIDNLRRITKRPTSRGYNFMSNSHVFPSSPSLVTSTYGTGNIIMSKSYAAPNSRTIVQRQLSADSARLATFEKPAAVSPNKDTKMAFSATVPDQTATSTVTALFSKQSEIFEVQDSTDSITEMFESSVLGLSSVNNNNNSNCDSLEPDTQWDLSNNSIVFPPLVPASTSVESSPSNKDTVVIATSFSNSNNNHRHFRRRNVHSFQRLNGALNPRNYLNFRQTQSPPRRKNMFDDNERSEVGHSIAIGNDFDCTILITEC